MDIFHEDIGILYHIF